MIQFSPKSGKAVGRCCGRFGSLKGMKTHTTSEQHMDITWSKKTYTKNESDKN
jgi:hypothetical protein